MASTKTLNRVHRPNELGDDTLLEVIAQRLADKQWRIKLIDSLGHAYILGVTAQTRIEKDQLCDIRILSGPRRFMERLREDQEREKSLNAVKAAQQLKLGLPAEEPPPVDILTVTQVAHPAANKRNTYHFDLASWWQTYAIVACP